MKIVVNTRLLLKNKLEGIGWFTYETLKRITIAHPEHHFVFLFDRDFDEEFIFSENVTPVVLSPQARHPILFYWWFEHSVASFLNRYKPDLFLSPDGYLSLNSNVKQLAVIHDLNFEHYPKDLPFLVRKYYHYFFPKFARKATRIATVSQFSKNDIVEQYNVPSANIDVVYNGCNKLYKPLSEEEKQHVKQKYTSGCDYFIFVGALHPRKNISRLFQAFDKFKQSKTSDIKLLIVGEKYYWTNEIKRTYLGMKYKEDVVFTGHLSTRDLTGVMGAALALTYVPYFEGFGIPILEAMNCNVPVITSNITSMPEVAGNAALYADPFSVDSIAQAMIVLYSEDKVRNALIEKGKVRKLDFSWDKTSQALWKSIERSIG